MIATVAPGYGVTVSDEELDTEIRRMFAPNVGNAEVDARQIEREFQDRYGSFLNEIQLDKSAFRAEVRKQLLRERFRQYIGENVSTVAPHARVHRIVLSPQDELELIREKFEDLLDGRTEPAVIRAVFKAIAREFSRDDAEVVRQGGDLGWAPRGTFKDYDDLIFSLEVGELSVQIPNFDDPNELFIFLVSETDEARQVDPWNLDRLKTLALQDWLNGERANHEVFATFNSDIYSWILEQVKLTSTITPTPAPNPLGGGL